MGLLSKLTLVLVTYKRHQFALRNMQYWSGREATVLVLDGTDQPIDSVLLEGLEDNIRYHHLPISVHERLALSIKLIDEQSEFVALYGDDEFFSPTALEACIAELEKDQSLVSCMGRTIGFNPTENGLIGRPWYSEMKGYALMQDDPIERMVTHMGTYTCSTIYSVIRTPVWKHAMDAFSKHVFTVFSMEEYIFEMVVAFMGKSKVLPVLYWFRSLENERIIQNDNKFNIWWNRDSSTAEKEFFIDLMTDALSVKSGTDKKTIRKGIIKTGDAFTQWANASVAGPVASRQGFLARLLSFGIRKLQGVKRRLLKDKDLSVADKKKMYPFAEAIDQLKMDGVIVNEQEISEIENRVMNFYRSKKKSEALEHV
jgi:glycosyltransferase domain-containing protein